MIKTVSTPELPPIINSPELSRLIPHLYVSVNALYHPETRNIIIGENNSQISTNLPKIPLGVYRDETSVSIISESKDVLISPEYTMWLGRHSPLALEQPSPALLFTPIPGQQDNWHVDALTKVTGVIALERFAKIVGNIASKKQQKQQETEYQSSLVLR